MINEDNACIRYLMKEMDPSEEVLMERAMMEDDDLLIEVESLRQTLRRLDKAPELDPPSHLSESIIRQAADHARNNQSPSRLIPLIDLRYAAAAAVIAGVALGSFWMFSGNSGQSVPAKHTNRSVAARVNPSSAKNVTQAASQTAAKQVQPWIDHNNIIRFQDLYDNNTSNALEAILKSSARKLTPLNDQFDYQSGVKSLELTSSPVSNN